MATKEEKFVPEAETSLDTINTLSPVITEDFDDEESFRPSQIKIMQPQSPEVANKEVESGVFYTSMNGSLGESINFIPLGRGRFRIFNNPDPNKVFGENEIVCSSRDAVDGVINPESDYEHKNLITGDCRTCPMAKWGERNPKTGRDEKPKCTLTQTFAVYLPEEEVLGRLDFARTATEAGQSIARTVRYSKGGWGTVAFKESLRLIKQGSTSYYKPTVRKLKPEEIEEGWFEAASEALEQVRAQQG